jgi:hypothetical protein
MPNARTRTPQVEREAVTLGPLNTDRDVKWPRPNIAAGDIYIINELDR